MKCQKCGFENESVAKYCVKCGTALTEKRKSKIKIIVASLMIVLMVLVGIVVFIFFRPEEKSYTATLEQAQRYMTELNYEEAETLYLEAIDIDPKKADAYVALAKMYLECDNPEKALNIILSAKDAVSEEEIPVIEAQEEAIQNETVSDISVSDAYTDYRVITSTTPSTEVCYHIPRLDLSNHKADAVNQEIYDELYALLDERVYQELEVMPDAEPSLNRMIYIWGQNKDLVSINVFTSPYYHFPEFYIYNISLTTGQRLSDEAFLKELDLSLEDFQAKAKEIVATYWQSQEITTNEYLTEELIQSVTDKTLAKENLAQAKPYLNQQGELCFAIKVYSLAGADYYWNLFNTVTGKVEPEIVCEVAH